MVCSIFSNFFSKLSSMVELNENQVDHHSEQNFLKGPRKQICDIHTPGLALCVQCWILALSPICHGSWGRLRILCKLQIDHPSPEHNYTSLGGVGAQWIHYKTENKAEWSQQGGGKADLRPRWHQTGSFLLNSHCNQNKGNTCFPSCVVFRPKIKFSRITRLLKCAYFHVSFPRQASWPPFLSKQHSYSSLMPTKSLWK